MTSDGTTDEQGDWAQRRLAVLQPTFTRRLVPWGLRVYRLLVLAAIVWLIRDQQTRLRIDGDRPIALQEVQAVFPQASELRADHGPRPGLAVFDDEGRSIGYVARTQPQARGVIGFSGVTDALMAFDAAGTLVKLTIRHSDDTRSHVQDVRTDRRFMKKFDGRTWEQLAGLDLAAEGIEGVSGATLTSMALAESVVTRATSSVQAAARSPAARWGAHDIGTVAVILAAMALAFSSLRQRTWLRRALQAIVIGYLGLTTGHLLAQSLLAGWASTGVGWRLAPGLTLLAAAAMVVPWATRRQVYCSHLCPHGAAQELLGRVLKRKLRLRHDVASALRWIPPLLIAWVIFAVMLRLPTDLAAIEPFDAWLLTRAGLGTILVAIVGLVASLFIPQAYCRFGCPTGELLEFVRSHGHAGGDRLRRRDIVAALLVGLTALLYWQHEAITRWLILPDA
jgi:hypothetical protein